MGGDVVGGAAVTPSIRPARPGEEAGILRVVEDAFSYDGTRNPEEELTIVRGTWSARQNHSLIELVAAVGGTVVGHVQAAPGRLDGAATPVAGVAPVSVGLSSQGHGVGSALMTALISVAEDRHWPLLVLLGNPAYYERFGFEAAGPLGVDYPPVGAGNRHFQARRLTSYRPALRGEFTYCWEG